MASGDTRHAAGQGVEGKDQAAFARRRAGQVVGAAAADVVLVLGDVGQLQEVAEGADDGLVVSRGSGSSRAASSARAAGSPSRAKRTAVCRTRSTMSKTASPSCSRTVSPKDAAKQADVVAERFVLAGIERVWCI
jgi:hypothetical protein